MLYPFTSKIFHDFLLKSLTLTITFCLVQIIQLLKRHVNHLDDITIMRFSFRIEMTSSDQPINGYCCAGGLEIFSTNEFWNISHIHKNPTINLSIVLSDLNYNNKGQKTSINNQIDILGNNLNH